MKEFIENIPDFPIKGVLFRDITPLLASPSQFQNAIDQLIRKIEMSKVDVIAGIESRGFILGAAMAAKCGKGFVLIRKSGKLPPPVHSHEYSLEYGQGVLEMKAGKGRALIVDDVLATGGTLAAAIELCAKAGFQVSEIAVLLNLKYLNNFKWNSKSILSLIDYES